MATGPGVPPVVTREQQLFGIRQIVPTKTVIRPIGGASLFLGHSAKLSVWQQNESVIPGLITVNAVNVVTARREEVVSLSVERGLDDRRIFAFWQVGYTPVQSIIPAIRLVGKLLLFREKSLVADFPFNLIDQGSTGTAAGSNLALPAQSVPSFSGRGDASSGDTMTLFLSQIALFDASIPQLDINSIRIAGDISEIRLSLVQLNVWPSATTPALNLRGFLGCNSTRI